MKEINENNRWPYLKLENQIKGKIKLKYKIKYNIM